MKIRFRLFLLVLSCGFIVAGCTKEQAMTATGAPLARQVLQSAHCGLTAPGQVVIDNPEKLERLEMLPAMTLSLETLKAINYEREQVVLASIGQKPTGGFGVTLDGSEIIDDVLYLTIRVTEPAPGAMVTQALTTPCVVIAVTAEGWDDIQITRAENNR